jgi:hypothetical protein
VREKAGLRRGFPPWRVEDLGEHLVITCPRCDTAATVIRAPWLDGPELTGSKLTRSCPYCFRASGVPPELLT